MKCDGFISAGSPCRRGRKLKESAVKALAKQHHIPVYTPLTLRVEKGGEETAEVLAKMQEANADVLVVAAYGLIVPQFVLDIPSGVLPQKFPTLKAVNIHAVFCRSGEALHRLREPLSAETRKRALH